MIRAPTRPPGLLSGFKLQLWRHSEMSPGRQVALPRAPGRAGALSHCLLDLECPARVGPVWREQGNQADLRVGGQSRNSRLGDTYRHGKRVGGDGGTGDPGRVPPQSQSGILAGSHSKPSWLVTWNHPQSWSLWFWP